MDPQKKKRVGDDLYLYKGTDVFIVENYYKKKDKRIRVRIKKFFDSRKKKILWAVLLIGIIIVAYFINTPFSKFTSNQIEFYFETDKNEFRTGYSINFRWNVSNLPSQAIIIWGDGTTLDLKDNINNREGILFGTINHSYNLQGKYSPTLHIWDAVGHQYSKILDVTIQNNMLQFNISCQNKILEDQELFISVENVFELNKELRRDIEDLTYLYDFGDAQLTSNKSEIMYKWKNEGNYTLTIGIIDSQGTISRRSKSIQVKNKPPEATFSYLRRRTHPAVSEIKFSAENSVDTESDENSLRYLWNWGDGITSWGKFSTHSYAHMGEYNITLWVIDDNGIFSTYSEEIYIFPGRKMEPWFEPPSTEIIEPYVAIGTLPDIVYEDDQVQLISKIGLREGNITDYIIYWSFGDSFSSFEKSPKHAWPKAGIYTITLYVTDRYANSYITEEEITIKEKAPEILGPFSFQGVEGKTIILDIEVYDAILDEPHLKFNWYDQNNNLFSTNKKPSIVLDDGNYRFTFNVTDHSGLTTSREVNIIIHPIAPEIYIPNYMYHGPPGDIFRSDDVGRLNLRAYSSDCTFDLSKLRFDWYITNGKDKNYYWNVYDGNVSQITFKCRETTIYQGEVKVSDPSGNTRIVTFEIYSNVDSRDRDEDDESTKKLEQLLDIKLSGPEDSVDSDNDNLSDLYEIEVSGTNPFNPDTDNDGLYDGFDNTGVGEQTLGTSPTENDSDFDGLEDGLEYFGWNISINYFEHTSLLHVNSDPLRRKTDSDYLSDYEEFLLKTHPRLIDSDSDKLDDFRDPYPTTWDYDEDKLSDYMEEILGTNMSNSDSDGDGLKDGEEVLGLKTDPTHSDSDFDFAPDNAELVNYKISLEDEYGKDIRVNLTEPISLYFPKFFTTATIAQIAFTISFGEYGSDESQDYGVKEADVTQMNVIITKPDDGIILYNSVPNITRYFSQVVDITDIMNNETLAYNYYGEYLIEIRDLNGRIVSGCLLEKFELDFSRQLDPNCEDSDGDGIMDGVEMGLLVRGTKRIDIKDFYNSTSKGTQYNYENQESNEFSLEIPDIGRVYGASLAFEIRSSENLKEKGNITVEVVYKNIKTTIDDTIIFSLFEEFDSNDNYFYKSTLNLSNFITNGIISEYYGEYSLNIRIQSTNSNDKFYISEFYIETDTYIQAGPYDTNAWITDASLYDSDADGWSDYYEIFTSKTSPLNKDTDGDEAWDSNDRDPLRNVMIEIRPISGTFKNQIWLLSPPALEIIIQFQINDLIDPNFSEESNRINICTPSKLASTDPLWDSFQTAWWNQGEGTYYYYDINDDITIQSNTIPFYFQLWEMLDFGDIDIFNGEWLSNTYSINEVGYWEELVVQKNGDSVRCQIETVAIERANTIAIFDPNGTSFTGHYNNEERMNIILLHVTEDGHYPATLSFEHEIEGSIATDWIDNEGWDDQSNPGQNPTIIDELGGHSKVLQFQNNIFGNGRIIHNWNTEITSGTVELWMRNSNFKDVTFMIRDGNDQNSIHFRFTTIGNIRIKTSSGHFDIDRYTTNKWIHVKFEWDCNEDWHLWVDGKNYNRLINGIEFLGTPTAMDSLVIQTEGGYSSQYFYVDAIGYSFDPNYSIGDNLKRSTSNGTPFIPGLNVIVIPTSLFDNTILNSYIQNKQLEKTPLYTEQEGLFEFYSIDRDGNVVDDQCGDTDFVFVRYEITAQDAMTILNSLLTCATNESKDENNNTIITTAKIFKYVSTKLNSIKPISMNLPQSLLSFIPWISNFVNSEYGSAPVTVNFFGIFLIAILSFLFPLIGLTVTIFITISLFSEQFAKIIAEIGMAILTFLAKLLWILIRVALIILFYIVLAIELITIIPLFLAMGIGLSIFSWFLDMNVNFGVNCFPLYAQDTRVGHVGINIKGSDFILEAWVKWIYWTFFDLYIPYVDMNLQLDPDSPLMQPPEDPSSGTGTFLTCGYDQINDYIFNFHTIYWDIPYNSRPQYVILTLLSPSGNAYNYSMDIAPVGHKSIDYWTGKKDLRTGDTYTYDDVEHTFVPPNWYRGVLFNVTIDFESEFTVNERNGQWYYQFRTIAERENAVEVIWPYDEYAIGPYFNETGNISEEPDFEGLQYTELAPFSGHANQEFNFSVIWADYEYNTLPTEVYLVIELPNGRIHNYEMSAFASVQYDYSMVSDYGWVTFTEYKNIINFSEYMITETFLLKHHYRAVHSNGNVETLFDTKHVDELGRIVDSEFESDDINTTEIDVWFEGPTVFPYSDGKPLIKKWEVQDLTNNIYLTKFNYGDMIWEELELVFWVYVYDPDRSSDFYRRPICYADGYPTVTLSNYEDPTDKITFKDFTWSEYDNDLQADKFWVQVGANEIGVGLWNFEFTINDTQGDSYTISKEKLPRIWIVGSVNEIFRERTTAMNYFGFIPTLIFTIMAALAATRNHYVQIAATIGTLATAIITTAFVINEINILATNKNSGALIGLGLALITIAPILYLSLGRSSGSGSNFGANGFQASNLGYFFTNIFSLIGGIIFLFTDLSSTLYNIFFAFADVFHLISLSMVLGITVNSITQAGGKNFDASKWIKVILKAYSLILLIIGFICFITASEKNGALVLLMKNLG